MYVCSYCKKKLEKDIFVDAIEYLSSHIGIYCKLIRVLDNVDYDMKYS